MNDENLDQTNKTETIITSFPEPFILAIRKAYPYFRPKYTRFTSKADGTHVVEIEYVPEQTSTAAMYLNPESKA